MHRECDSSSESVMVTVGRLTASSNLFLHAFSSSFLFLHAVSFFHLQPSFGLQSFASVTVYFVCLGPTQFRNRPSRGNIQVTSTPKKERKVEEEASRAEKLCDLIAGGYIHIYIYMYICIYLHIYLSPAESHKKAGGPPKKFNCRYLKPGPPPH